MSRKKLMGVESVDYVVCQVCGGRFRSITFLHLKTHNITSIEYKKLYPDAEFQCDSMKIINREKNSGKNSAVYNPEVDKFIEENTNKHLCGCGCGEYIKIVRDHYSMGIPKFIKNHGVKSEEVRNKISESVKKIVGDSKWKEEQSNIMIQYYKDHPDKTTKGYKQSEETIEKNRIGHLGIKATDITREKMSNTRMGYVVDEGTKQKISKTLIGHDVTDDTKRRISASHQGILYKEWKNFITEENWRDWGKVIYINEIFPGCHRHHITETIVICIPAELHNHISHNLKTGRNMAEINMLALQFINGCYNDK